MDVNHSSEKETGLNLLNTHSVRFLFFICFPLRAGRSAGRRVGRTHTATELLSEFSAGTGDSGTSAGRTSGSGRWIRKNRKLPTRLMTVSEMNTVCRSLSETQSIMGDEVI